MFRKWLDRIKSWFLGADISEREFEYHFLRLYSQLLHQRAHGTEEGLPDLLIRFEGLLFRFLDSLDVPGNNLPEKLRTDEARLLFGNDLKLLQELASKIYDARTKQQAFHVNINDVVKAVEIIRKLWKHKIKT